MLNWVFERLLQPCTYSTCLPVGDFCIYDSSCSAGTDQVCFCVCVCVCVCVFRWSQCWWSLLHGSRPSVNLTMLFWPPSVCSVETRCPDISSGSKTQQQAHCVKDLRARLCEAKRFVFWCVSCRLLLSKPKAASNMLSENSLLKDLNFDERFLGEEMVIEGKEQFTKCR